MTYELVTPPRKKTFTDYCVIAYGVGMLTMFTLIAYGVQLDIYLTHKTVPPVSSATTTTDDSQQQYLEVVIP